MCNPKKLYDYLKRLEDEKVVEPVPPTPPARPIVIYLPCPDCNGTGWLKWPLPVRGKMVDVKCTRCEGTGQIAFSGES